MGIEGQGVSQGGIDFLFFSFEVTGTMCSDGDGDGDGGGSLIVQRSTLPT